MMKKAVLVWAVVWGVVGCALGAAWAGGAPRGPEAPASHPNEMDALAGQLRDAVDELLQIMTEKEGLPETGRMFVSSQLARVGCSEELAERVGMAIDGCLGDEPWHYLWFVVMNKSKVVYVGAATREDSASFGTAPPGLLPDETLERFLSIDEYSFRDYDYLYVWCFKRFWLGMGKADRPGPVVTGPEDGLWVEGEAGKLEAEARNCGDFAVALAEEVSDGVTNVVSLEMVGIEPGSFTMGSPEGETGRDDEGNHERQHEVVLSHGFWLGRYEVTQEQYAALMGGNPSRHGGEGLPVECVTWADAKAFCARLTDREKKAGRLPEGYVYSLPTEAQWEYACRAGTTAALGSGMNLTNAAVDDAAGEVAWYAGNAEGTQAVGQKPGNGWGLYDMHGNVAEWCADGPWEYPAGGTSTDPAGFWPIC